jgi:hypothetical protein
VDVTPQEKKRLSYERDRRNTYGENDKSSRKNIPRGKRLASRAARRSASVALLDVRGRVDTLGVVEGYGDPDVVDGAPADRAEQRIAGRRPPRFRKWPDTARRCRRPPTRPPCRGGPGRRNGRRQADPAGRRPARPPGWPG